MSKTDEQGQTRAEKLSLLTTLLGPEAMARVRAGQAPENQGEQVDPERIAWHRNRLIERLRAQPREAEPKAVLRPPRGRDLDARLSTLVNWETLSQEHPAVIVRILAGMPRAERAALLKTLPGPLARRLLHRMRRV